MGTSVLWEDITHKIHTKPHPGLGWHIFHILTSDRSIDDFTGMKFRINISIWPLRIYPYPSPKPACNDKLIS